MKVVGVRDLKDNPSGALRAAREQPVLITNRGDPEAMLLSMRDLGEHTSDVRLALATALFDQGALSLGRAAGLAGVPLGHFVEHLGSRGIPVFRQSPQGLEADMAALRR